MAEARRALTRGGWAPPIVLSAASAPAAAILCLIVLAGCSTMSDAADAANPLKWFEREEKIAPEEQKDEDGKKEEGESATAKSDQNYPNLATVPDRPKTSTREEREIIVEGLLADRENARYAEGPPPRVFAKPAPPGPAVVRTEVVEQPAASAPAEVAKAPKNGVVRLLSIAFVADAIEPAHDVETLLRRVAAARAEHGGRLHIVGHTDSRLLDPDTERDHKAKMRLSAVRAGWVARVLAGMGVRPEDMSVDAKGDAEPSAATPQGSEQGRAEIFLVDTKSR